MCFLLFAGTERQLPRRPWNETTRDVCVEALTEANIGIKSHFTKPHVQYVGSTSGCGCNFHYVSLHDGHWPVFVNDQKDPEWEAEVRRSREDLVALLRDTGEECIELYGVWDGDFDQKPKSREAIPLDGVTDESFLFKEQGFYLVEI